MRRPLWIRIVTAMWAIWLGAALSEPMAMQPFAMMSAAQMANMAGMPGMGGASSSNLAHHDMPSHDSGTCAHCRCDCCCAAPTVAPSGSTPVLPEPAQTPRIGTLAQCDGREPAAAPPHSLPFANGPPATRYI